MKVVTMEERYYSYKKYLQNLYGEKVYKLPIQIPVECPNKNKSEGNSGCAFCSSLGTGFESLHAFTPIVEQLNFAKEKITSRYQARKFIGYFQNYTNTNIPVEQLIEYLNEVIEFGVVGIDIATRPDCISREYVKVLKEYSISNKVDITFEIGLQIANDTILDQMNRGHTVNDFIQCVNLLNEFEFPVCVHIILNLPESTDYDVRTTVNLLNQLECSVVKLHSLYIPNDCALSAHFIMGEVHICTFEEYIQRAIYVITHLDPNIAISRLVSRIPSENALFSNWGMSWWKVYNEIMDQLVKENLYQGIYRDR